MLLEQGHGCGRPKSRKCAVLSEGPGYDTYPAVSLPGRLDEESRGERMTRSRKRCEPEC